MDSIEKVASHFERFPGIGPRQAQRFVQFLLRASPAFRRELSEAIQALASGAHQCRTCMRYFSGSGKVCGICADCVRAHDTLAIVATDADLMALERSGTYSGQYFVLGGTIHLASEKATSLRIPQLLESLPSRMKQGLEEIILALPANPEGDATAARVKEEISTQGEKLRITSLGRGLSTGSELEYADTETLRSALESRR